MTLQRLSPQGVVDAATRWTTALARKGQALVEPAVGRRIHLSFSALVVVSTCHRYLLSVSVYTCRPQLLSSSPLVVVRRRQQSFPQLLAQVLVVQ